MWCTTLILFNVAEEKVVRKTGRRVDSAIATLGPAWPRFPRRSETVEGFLYGLDELLGLLRPGLQQAGTRQRTPTLWSNPTVRTRILHLADLHLGASVSAELREVAPEAADKLQQARDGLLDAVADWVTNEDSEIALVLVAGDLFERHDPPDELVRHARLAVDRMARKAAVVTVPGNHDEWSYPNCVFRQHRQLWPGQLVTESEPAVVWKGELDDGTAVEVVSAAYEAGRVSPGHKLALPECPDKAVRVLLAHGTLIEPFSEQVVEGDRCFRISHQQAATAGYRYLALGHIHRAESWQLDETVAAYPGPPIGRSLDDPGSNYLMTLRLSGGTVSAERLNPPELFAVRWEVEPHQVAPGDKPADVVERLCARWKAQHEHAGREVVPTVIRGVRLEGNISGAGFAAECQQLLAARGYAAVVDDRRATPMPEVDIESLAREATLAGEFVRQWERWCEEAEPDRGFAQKVLLEGLAVLVPPRG